VLLFVNILSVIEVLVPRHGTNPLGCRALWHGTALPGLLSAVPGPEWWHGGTTRHGTVRMPCLIVPCLIVPCRAVLVPYRARAARLENFTLGSGDIVRIGCLHGRVRRGGVTAGGVARRAQGGPSAGLLHGHAVAGPVQEDDGHGGLPQPVHRQAHGAAAQGAT